MSYNTNSNLTRRQITLNLKDFGYFSDKKNDLIPIIKDNWELSWKLNYKNTSKKFKVNHFVKENKYKSIITNIEISPISISANLIGCSYDDFEIKSLTATIAPPNCCIPDAIFFSLLKQIHIPSK